MSKPKSSKKTPVTVYVPVSHHIYFNGTSYRVRVTKDGETQRASFSSKRKAYIHRKQLLAK